VRKSLSAKRINKSRSEYKMKAKVLSEVYDIFDQQEALSGDKLREYYVKRESPVKSIADILSSEKPLKYLFVGSRGNGKSTELNRLSELIKDKLFVVSFSIKDKLNLFDVDYFDGRKELHNINVNHRNGNVDHSGYEVMREVALRSMEEDLITEEAMAEAIKSSAGAQSIFPVKLLYP